MTNPDQALWIREQDVCQLIDLVDAIELVHQTFVGQGRGESWPLEKTHASWGSGHTLHALGGGDNRGFVGVKSWAHTSGGAAPLLVVWDAESGRLAAVIEAFALGQLRTASVSGVATNEMAPSASKTLAIVGSGRQSLPQVAAALAVRRIETVCVWSPNEEHRHQFGKEVEQSVPGCVVLVKETLEDAVAEADVITTATRSKSPFLAADLLPKNVHINAVGAITVDRGEIHPKLTQGSAIVASDSPQAASKITSEGLGEVDIQPLSRVLAATHARARDGISLFKAMGSGMADVALGAEILSRARLERLGEPLPNRIQAEPRLFGREVMKVGGGK